jgi:hypothetical protein
MLWICRKINKKILMQNASSNGLMDTAHVIRKKMKQMNNKEAQKIITFNVYELFFIPLSDIPINFIKEDPL